MSGQAWIQISAGRGPVECARAAGLLADRLEGEAAAAGLAAARLHTAPGPVPGSAVSALLAVEGDGAVAFARSQEGSVQWICKSPDRPGHKRKNWFVGVAAIEPPADGGAEALDRRDLRVETCRASGPGGQNVNKRDTAVRIVHVPSGLAAQAQEERSQARNKALALARLAELLADRSAAAQAETRDALWRAHSAIERGAPVRIFRGPRFEPER